jgi:hypothetical protein
MTQFPHEVTMAHNTPQRNAEFQAVWAEDNARYIASTKWAIGVTFRRRHESAHVRQACRENIAFFRKHNGAKK